MAQLSNAIGEIVARVWMHTTKLHKKILNGFLPHNHIQM
jgi:hypothetical protein